MVQNSPQIQFDNMGANGDHVDVLVLNTALHVEGALSDHDWEKANLQTIRIPLKLRAPASIQAPFWRNQVREKGMAETILNWDDVSLPGAFAVWCASDEAAFLHGRFVWSAWYVEELKSGSIRDRLHKDGQFLRIGVHGL
ncbi:peroxisomal short-chain alcohol dehydrogenase [Fusarium sp. NRRL 52700]|nr:peroxisomal short-chain alcohol dehydrogenase [Fusarium sp. NRRL 52700]